MTAFAKVIETTASHLRYTSEMSPSTNDLSALKAQLDSLRPLTDLQIQRLWPQWESEDALFIYATNAIVGLRIPQYDVRPVW